jgi:hypothetical protein
MTVDARNEWEKELSILLDKVKNHPSADLSAERERIGVLQQLMRAEAKEKA